MMESKCYRETLSEDTVSCYFFPTTLPNSYNLEELCEALNSTIYNLTTEYIWHRDEYKVHVPLNTGRNDLPVHLVSLTSFGDNIEDEWYIVHLLLEISKIYPNLVIQVYDNDGEFLLIEAADSLPSWANPDTTYNRVFIYQNHIHFIPPNIVDTDTEITIQDAIKIICDKQNQTKSSAIHEAVLKRIGDPQKFIDNVHRAVVTLPLHIAAVLALKPSLISPIVHAYCHHDVIDAKGCKNIKFDDTVPTQVKFTKCLYAMLIHSKLIKTIKSPFGNNKNVSLGFKITCGYEIIMRKQSGDIFSSKEFNQFLKSLSRNGYFKDNLEGSQDYKKLLESAKAFFLTMECPINTKVCEQISKLMHSDEFFNMKETTKSSKSLDFVDESDEWLNIHPDQLNDLLNSRYGQQTKFKSGDVINHHNITTELSNFLKQTSDFEGIETNAEDTENIEFDSDEFVNSLKKMMDLIAPGNKIDSDFDDETEDESISEEELDRELKEKLNIDNNIRSKNDKQILVNMRQSMKEEGGASGPSSNILRTIGFNKSDILDSDDDIE